MNRDHTGTLAGLGHRPGSDPPNETPSERTRTLRGLGLQGNTLRGLGEPAAQGAPETHACPGCRVSADAVSADLAAMLGVALVVVKGAEATRATFCRKHARLLRLLQNELETGPRATGRGESWDD